MRHVQITFSNQVGRFDVDVTTFQMAVLFAWNQRPLEKISYENLRLATELPDPELRRTLWSLCAFPKLKRQLLLVEPHAHTPKDFGNDTRFWVNQEFAIVFVSSCIAKKKNHVTHPINLMPVICQFCFSFFLSFSLTLELLFLFFFSTNSQLRANVI